MDWLKLFTLLVAVAFVPITADGPKKKIRIHLPQKVKHIHHHKKIYITNHPASAQYAPAYAEGTVAVPNIAVPFNSVELYDEAPARLPGVASAGTHLVPLYHTRGYYGPTQTEIEEHEYETEPDSEESYGPPAYSSVIQSPSSRPPKRVKIIKVNEPPRKKVIRKGKPKRVGNRNKPQPHPQSEEEHPVSTFHEQFYSDVDSSGTIRKIRKPPRVEKILDGDTEHIHTYSEEHIHKVLDNAPRVAGIVGVDPLTAMTAIAGPQHVIPFKGGQAIIAVPTNPYASLSAVSPMGNPTHFEYAAYNPREVTHDHIFHDHGEIPADVNINKETIGLPPKISYNSQGLRVSGANHLKSKSSQRLKKSKSAPVDLSYYEGIYAPIKQKKNQQPRLLANKYETADEANFRSLLDLGNNVNPRVPSTTYYGKTSNDYRVQKSSAPAPFSVSSTIVHDYKPKAYPGSTGGSLTNLKDPYGSFKDTYANNFEYDAYASSSSLQTSEDKNDFGYETQGKRGKKKSVSTQNISFGGKDHISIIDHLKPFEQNTDSSEPTALDNLDQFDDHSLGDLITPSPVTLKESSPAHQYYSAMAVKAFQDDPLLLSESSNDNFEYVEAPNPSTTPFVPSVATTLHTPTLYAIKNIETTTEPPNFMLDSRQNNKERETNKNSNIGKNENERHTMMEILPTISDYRAKSITNQEYSRLINQDINPTTVRSKLKYGDKI